MEVRFEYTRKFLEPAQITTEWAASTTSGAIFTLPWFLECLVSPWGSLPRDRINTMQLCKCFSDPKCFSKATKIVSGN